MRNRLYYLRFIRTIDSPAPEGGSESTDPQPTEDESTEQHDAEALHEPGLKALKAEREAAKAAKAQLAEAQAKLKEFEDRDKTEAEKTAEKLKALEESSTTAATKALRFEVALDKGLPKPLAARLQGSTREEMEADADELLKLVHSDSPKAPKPDKSQAHGGNPKAMNLSDAVSNFYNN